MLSSQSSELRPGHQRQNSTPVNSGVTNKAPYIPVTYSNQQQSHRRGLSQDHSNCAYDTPTSTNPGNGTVSTNQGLYEQQQLRETQTHGPSRPGHQHDPSNYNFEDILIPKETSEYDFDKALERGFGEFEQLELDLKSHNSFGPLLDNGLDMNILEPQQQHKMTSSHDTPHTPRRQNTRNIYPMTPTSGHPHSHRMEAIKSSPGHTGQLNFGHVPQASPMKRGSSWQESSTMKWTQSTGGGIPSPPHTAPLGSSATFDMAPISNPELLDTRIFDIEFGSRRTGYSSSNYSPMTSRTSPALSSMLSSPDLAPVSLFGDIANGVPRFPTSGPQSPGRSPRKSRASSPKKKSQDLTEDMIIEETGITIEQVDAFIQGPDPESNTYTCLYEDCKFKPFPRKENIRAHVQTHLGDRKYVCTKCGNKFVRPNDLKRHANTHQENKEFVCICTAAFGRQDALRRHRQRKPFCLNGDPTLELKTKEEKKRGRPRKIAPTETIERRERKETIRKQVMAKKRSGSVATSVTTSHSSPATDYCSPEQMEHNSPSLDYSPGQMSLTPPASPSVTTSSVFSPFHSQHSRTPRANDMSPPPTRDSMTTPLELDEVPFDGLPPFKLDSFEPHEPSLPTNEPSNSASSQYGTPPELEISSSSPASRFLDFDNTTSSNQSSQSAQDLGDLFDLGAQGSLDEMYPLFGDGPMLPTMQKVGGGSNDFNLTFTEEFDWGSN